MTQFTLFGNYASAATDRVRLFLAVINFKDYEFVNMDYARGDLKSPEHLCRHPWARIPALTIDLSISSPTDTTPITLYESRPIIKYLATVLPLPSHLSTLLPPPTNPLAIARFDIAQSVEMSYFSPQVEAISFEKFVKPLFDGVTDDVVINGAREKLEIHFDALEKVLAGSGAGGGDRDGSGKVGFVAGPEFGLVDIFYLPMVMRLLQCGEGDTVFRAGEAKTREQGMQNERINVKTWWDTCLDLGGVKDYLDCVPTKESTKKSFAEMGKVW